MDVQKTHGSLRESTVVLGLFDQAEISFKIGDCRRMPGGCIKIFNVKSIDEEHPIPVPTTMNIMDKRLRLQDISKKDVRNYFSYTKERREEQIPARKKKKKYHNLKRGTYKICSN